MRKYICCLFLLCSIGVLFCKGEGSTLEPYLFSFSDTITNPTLRFEYGNVETKLDDSDHFLKEERGGVCLFSLPENLYYLETGARFKVCLPANKEQVLALKSGFESLDQDNESKTLFHVKHELWEASETTFGKWEKENKDLLPIESLSNNHTADGTISFSRFDVPAASLFQWDKDTCEVTLPSRRIGPTKNSWKIISIHFKCSPIDIKDTIVTQNEKWLKECVPRAPSLSESFRHSDSPFGRFIEWANESEEVLCPLYESMYFQDEISGNATQLDPITFSSLKEYHKLLLPHSVFLLSSSEQLGGIKVPDSFLLNVGKKGTWYLGIFGYLEIPYSFKQGDEFFSRSLSRPSCRNQTKYQFSTTPTCLNPGLPNQLTKNDENPSQSIPSCQIQNLRFTEFYSGNVSTIPIPAFLEMKNFGPSCDLSNITLNYEKEEFILSASEKVIQAEELIVISREKWEGWNFQTLIKPLSTKEFKFKIPYLTLGSLETQEVQSYLQDANDFVLTNWNGLVNRSIVFNQFGKLLPHPNNTGLVAYANNGFYLSPGTFVNTDDIPYLDLKFSEILLSGTKDQTTSYPERFVEWEDLFKREGYLYFQIESQKLERFIFYKDASWQFPFIKSGMGSCLPATGLYLPEGSLPNDNLKLTTLDPMGRPFDSLRSHFIYSSSLYESLGLSGSSRISIHPESSPFYLSYTSANSFGNSCSPYSEATPGKQNAKKNLIASNLSFKEGGVPESKTFSFLEQPSSTSEFSLVSLDRLHLVTSVAFHQVLDLWQENFGFTFSEEELIYLEWHDVVSSIHETHIFRLGEVRIEAVYPSPSNAQNEWIYFCNVSDHPVSTSGYVIEDETSNDLLVPYSVRFPSKVPNFSSGGSVRWNENNLGVGDCAFVVDPDGNHWNLPLFAKNTDILLTISSTQTIGNGISNSENLNLYKDSLGKRMLISTYGKKNSLSSFPITLKNLEYSLLKKDSLGDQVRDFQIFSENL